MKTLLHPTYFPSIAHFVALINGDNIIFEAADNFVKQTYRNRTYIYGANGKLALTIPVIHTQKERQKYRDVKVSHTEKWQETHWKSLLSAYRTSPFFEYYEDDLRPLFYQHTDLIWDFNLRCFEAVCECLSIEKNISKTERFHKNRSHTLDFRFLVGAKKEIEQSFDSYTQVFSNKHGFLSNLSILDLLFNEGPNTINYLENQTLIKH